MKRILILLALAAAASTAQAADVGVSIGFSQPGIYGQIDIGRFPQPAVIVPQPVLIAPPPAVYAQPQPIYLWVPPGHRKHWAKHCREYRACDRPVYFVRHDWYDANVRYADSRPGPSGEKRSKGKGGPNRHGRGHGHD